MDSERMEECQLLTVKEVARLLAIAPRSVWRPAVMGAPPRPLRLGTRTIR